MSSNSSADGPGVPDRGPAVFAVTTATLVLCSVFVAARLVSRIGIVRRVSLDDYTIVLAWLFAFALSLTIDLGTKVGLGKHSSDIPAKDKDTLKRCEYIFSVLYNPALMATKTSILIFYLRLSKNTEQVLRFASWLVLVIVNLAGTILTLLNIFQCRPINASFESLHGPTKCIPLLTEFICSAPVNIVTDLAILALPIPVLTGMRLPHRQKTILVITFALGVFVAVVDVVRIYFLQQAISGVSTGPSPVVNSAFGDSPDFPWNASMAFLWSAVEVNVGITCACIPTLKPLIIKILPVMVVDPDRTQTRSETQEKEASGSAPRRASRDGAAAAAPRARADPTSGNPQAPPAAHTTNGQHEAEMSMMEFLTTPDWVKTAYQGRGRSDNGNSSEVTAIDFLTTPDMVAPTNPSSQRQDPAAHPIHSQPAASSTTGTSTIPEDAVYFGFVNIRKPKSMLRASASESFKYCTVVTTLFLLWGFSYGLLNTLNNGVASVAGMSTAKTLGLTSAYFGGGYFFGPLLVGEWILRHDEHHRSRRRRSDNRRLEDSVGGFKATFMVGLCIYGTGTIMFWPSAVLASFPGFMVSSFVVGFGLGVLETGANPFLALCGPAEYSEMRLLLAQGVQGVGSVVSGLLAQDVFFADLSDTGSSSRGSMRLLDVQWTYLAITLFCVGLALFFYYMPLPEVSDAELERAAQRLAVDNKKRSLGGLRLQTVCLILAVLAQWCYIAVQECMSIFFSSLLLTVLVPSSTDDVAGAGAAASTTSSSTSSESPAGLAVSIPNYLLIAHTAFAVSRFAAGYLAYLKVQRPHSCLVPSPRTMLSASVAGCILFGILAVALRPASNPNLIVVPVVLFFFFEGPIWPLIFALGLRGQGKRTKRAGAYLTMGASGPLFWPFVMYGIIARGGTVQIAFVVCVALLAVTALYPLWLTLSRDAGMLIDPRASRLLPHGGRSPEEGMSRRPSAIDIEEMIRSRWREEPKISKEKSRGGGGCGSGRSGQFRRLSKVWMAARDRGKKQTMSASMQMVVEHREGEGESSMPESPGGGWSS